MMIATWIIIVILVVITTALAVTCAGYDAQITANEGYVKYLQGRIRSLETKRRSLPSGIETKSPILNRCNTMVLMASQSDDEEARTAALMACKIIRENQFDIVRLERSE